MKIILIFYSGLPRVGESYEGYRMEMKSLGNENPLEYPS